MVEEGVRDYQLAKRKAIQRLNLPWDKNLPGNDEVEAALADYLRLFHGARLDADVRRLRRLALDAMQFLERFDPRLVGAVVSGTVTADAPIQLHVTVDTRKPCACGCRSTASHSNRANGSRASAASARKPFPSSASPRTASR